ncbi:MAG: TrkH family potassium uptake protein [Bacteroidales bacterium]|nr:TrkH family potassium uptake protein [Bacteroidales bacterium]
MNNIKDLINVRTIIHLLGLAVIFESGFMLIDLLICVIYDMSSFKSIFLSFIITCTSGVILFFTTSKNNGKYPTRKDSYVLVFLAWIFLSLFGTLPFLISTAIPKFTNALFESVSGFTTTGASILNDIEAIPRGILFWRSETHWIGGMGIILFMLAIFPFFKSGGVHLLSAESSSVIFERIKPKLIDTIKRLWLIYLLLTVIETIFLHIEGMDVFDSLCHAFGTVATGGFSTKNNSIEGFSKYIQYTVLIFMILSGINFTLHYFLIKREFKKFITNEELKLYFSILVIAGVIVTLSESAQ